MIDAQSVETSANVAEASQGIDAGKKVKGRKGHLATDTLGLVLAVIVAAASVRDSTGGKRLIDEPAASNPSVTKVWADEGYQNSVFQREAARGVDGAVVKRLTTKGFQSRAKRWVVECTFGWLMQHRRPGPCRTPPDRGSHRLTGGPVGLKELGMH